MIGFFLKPGLLLLFLVLLAYFNTSIYDFPEPVPFSGEKLYNPYAGVDSSDWYVGNFHAHGNAWYGLSHGKGSTDDVYQTYIDKLGYDIIGISNYQQIDEHANFVSRIRAYEHGFSPSKNHQIIIGATKVCWKEYPLYQSLHHKQHILRLLKENEQRENVVAIAHPKRGMAYSYEDMKYLTHYDCVEAFNHLSTSRAHWDAALSAGHPVYLLSNDDSHDHEYLNHVARHLTMVHVEGEVNESSIVQAIKQGQTYGVEVRIGEKDDFRSRKQMISNLEKVEKISLDQQELFVRFSDTCDTIRFIGQNGVVKKLVTDATHASYRIRPEDTYIRTEARIKRTRHYIYLNPVFRYNGPAPEKKIATVNPVKTLIYRIFIALCMCIVISLFFLVERRKWLKLRSRKLTDVAV